MYKKIKNVHNEPFMSKCNIQIYSITFNKIHLFYAEGPILLEDLKPGISLKLKLGYIINARVELFITAWALL